MGNSPWGDGSKFTEIPLADIAANVPQSLKVIVPEGVGSTQSFMQIRTESGGSITIDSITID